MNGWWRQATAAVCAVLAGTLAATAADAPGAVSIDPPAGVYPEAGEEIAVTLSAAEGCAIYYTLDGSRPVCTNAAGEVLWSPTVQEYTGPLALANGRDDGPDAISRIMTGANEQDIYDPWYPPAEPPRTIPVLRAAAVDAEGRVGPIATASYLLGSMASRHGSAPVVSLCAEWADLFDNVNGPGIYRHPTAANKSKVPNAHVEYLADGARRVAKWCELRVQGTSTVGRPKKSLRLTGWKDYNPVKGKKDPFDHPFFADKPDVRKHACLIVRMGGNDWNKAILRDRLAELLLADPEVEWEAGATCVLYLDGVYWGVHELRERYESGFFKNQLGIADSDAFTLLEYADGKPFPQVNEGLGEDDEERTSAAYADFDAILRQLEAWDDDLADPARWTWFTNRINPDSLLRHFAGELYAGNSDWPQNNQRWWRAWPDGDAGSAVDRARPRNDGRWNWTFHDLDFAFALPFDYVPDHADGLGAAHDPYTGLFPGEGPYVGDWFPDAVRPFFAAMTNPAFRDRYLAHLHLRLATAWSAPSATAALDRIAAELRDAGMDDNGARWRQPQTATDFDRRIDDIRRWLLARPEAFAWHTRKRYGLGPLRDVVLAAGGTGRGAIRLAGSDVPLPLRAAFPSDLPLELQAVPAPGNAFAGWYATPGLLPPADPAPRAADCAANYTPATSFPAASLGTGWGPWAATYYGDGTRTAFVGTSAMPLHGRSENGTAFALRAGAGGYVTLLRELDGGSALAVGEEMSIDVAFGLSGGNGGAGVAFITAGGGSKPVQLILADEGGEGETYRLRIAGTTYLASNFPHIPGMPIRMTLAHTAADAWQLRLARGDTTYLADVALPAGTAITGVRLYKNPDPARPAGPATDLLFDRLRTAPDSGAPDADATVPLDAPLQRTTLFYEDGASLDAWTLATTGAAGAWRNTDLLCNIGTPSFGLWANNGGTSTLRRRFGFALATGCDLSFSFQNNTFDDPAACAGAILLTDTGESFVLLAAAGVPDYMLIPAGTGAPLDTGIPVVKTGIDVTVAPAADGTLAVTVAGRPFALSAPTAISGIEFFNRTAGPGTPCNVYANRIWVRADPGTAPAPSDPDPTPDPSTLFHETGAALANWDFRIWEGTSGGWAGKGSEYSAILGPDTFYLYAGSTNPLDYIPEAVATRTFPTNAQPTAGRTLSFRFAHGPIGPETPYAYVSGLVGWALLDDDENGLFTFYAHGDSDLCDIRAGTNTLDLATDVPKTPNTAHTATFRFATDTSVDFILDGTPLATGIPLSAPVRGIGFLNWMAGSGPERNFLFNDITVTATAEAESSASARRVPVTRTADDLPGTLLSTNTVFTLVPTNPIAVTAFFVPREGTDFEIWAADRGIDTPWTTNPATGRGYPEEYLLETNTVATLHQTLPDGTYALSFTPGDHGIAADIQVTDTLTPPAWRLPTPEELPPVESAESALPRFRPTPTNTPPRLFLRLVLRPLPE